MNIGRISVFTFKVDMIREMQMKTNQTQKGPPLRLTFLDAKVFLHFTCQIH